MNSTYIFYSFCWKLAPTAQGQMLTIFGRLFPDQAGEQRSISVNCEVGPGFTVQDLILYSKGRNNENLHSCGWYSIAAGSYLPYVVHHYPTVRRSDINILIPSLAVLSQAPSIILPAIHTLAINDRDPNNIIATLQYPIPVREPEGPTMINNVYRYGIGNNRYYNYIPLDYRQHVAILERSYGIDVEFCTDQGISNAPVKIYEEFATGQENVDYYTILLNKTQDAISWNKNMI